MPYVTSHLQPGASYLMSQSSSNKKVTVREGLPYLFTSPASTSGFVCLFDIEGKGSVGTVDRIFFWSDSMKHYQK